MVTAAVECKLLSQQNCNPLQEEKEEELEEAHERPHRSVSATRRG